MTLFPGYDPPSEPDTTLGPGQRLTRRQADRIAIGIHPLTEGRLHPEASRDRTPASGKTDPYTCGTCEHRAILGHRSRSYPKCVLYEARVTHSATTDVRAWWPACEDYTERTTT